MTNMLRLAAASLCLVTLASCGAGSPAERASVSPPSMSCAWPTELSAQTNNADFPDAASAVWAQPITAADTRIVLSGRFPDARYASLDVYTAAGVGASLPDYRIAPQPRSVNPWQRNAAPGGRFTITIRPDPSPGQANTLPLPPGTTSRHPGYLVYRVYLPARDDFADVPLPVLTVTEGRAARMLPGCRSHNAPVTLPAVAPAADTSGSATAAPPPPLEFYKPSASAFNHAGLADVDTTYIKAYMIRPPAPDVVVLTAKAPTFAPGSHPAPWPAPGEDVRYWSACIGVEIRHVPLVANKLTGGRIDYGCRADQATRLNAAGNYTYVIGSETQKAAIDRVPDVTFLPFSTNPAARLYTLVLRNMLVNAAFAHSPQRIAQAEDPAAAAAAMGPYYPRAAICTLALLTAKGPQGCER